MIQLSIIIVNYNVHYFLEQALQSVMRAGKDLSMEIIVVDNASSDKSVEMLKDKFPFVHLIENKINTGFSVANNQGIEIAKGEYVLLLNPDTVVQEDTFEKCLTCFKDNPVIGGLGVKMIDGKGNFLPESKRALPKPMVAFYKVFGLSSLFPKSERFAKYHLGHLDKNQNHFVEVLSGAFIMMPKKVLDEIGGLDETFFMYGEDIDLSYRVLKANYKNYYLADTEIIHYKGESTKKGSLNYVKVFYEAMLIFAKKHFSAKQARVYSIAIYAAIFIKGFLTIINNISKYIALPLLDALIAFGGLYLIAQFWAEEIKTGIIEYPREFIWYVIPSYIIIWILGAYFTGAYDKPYRVKSIMKGLGIGTLLIAAIYGFLPEQLRFSRALIILGASWSLLAMTITRLIYHVVKFNKFKFELDSSENIAIVGNNEEALRALNLLTQTVDQHKFIGFVSVNMDINKDNYLGELEHLATIVDLYNIRELIFCAENVATSAVIKKMTELGNELSYKILPSKSSSIIGSNSKNSAGDLYAIDMNLKLNSRRSRQAKRMFDILACFVLLASTPLSIWFIKSKLGFVKNLIRVLLGKNTWVGYLPEADESEYKLPRLQPAIIAASNKPYKKVKGLTGNRLNLLYAKDYSVELDLNYMFKNFSYLGNNLV